MMLATDWASLNAAADGFLGPGQNVLYADVDGHVGWRAAGILPLRAAGDDGRTPARRLEPGARLVRLPADVTDAAGPRPAVRPGGHREPAAHRHGERLPLALGLGLPHPRAAHHRAGGGGGNRRARGAGDAAGHRGHRAAGGGRAARPAPPPELAEALAGWDGRAAADSRLFRAADEVRRRAYVAVAAAALKGSNVTAEDLDWYNNDPTLLAAVRASSEAWQQGRPGRPGRGARRGGARRPARRARVGRAGTGSTVKHPFGRSGGVLGWIFNPPLPRDVRVRPLRPGGHAAASGRACAWWWTSRTRRRPRWCWRSASPVTSASPHRTDQQRDWLEGDLDGHAHPAARAAVGRPAGLRAVKRFADLYEALDSTTSTLAKVGAMARYFREAPARDAAWALWFLTGRRPKRLLGVRALVGWTLELTGTPGLALRRVLRGGGRPRRVHRAPPRRRHPGHPSGRDAAVGVDGAAHPPAPGPRRRGAAGAGDRVVARARPPRAVPPEQAAHRRAARRRLGDAGPPRAGRGGRAPAGAPGPAHDGRLDTLGGVPRAHPRPRARDRRRVAAVPLLPRLAARGGAGGAGRPRRVAGRSGSGTASAGSSSGAGATSSSGRAARSSSPSASRRWSRPGRRCPTGRCSTARCWPTARTDRCPSRCSRRASAGRRSPRRSSPRRRRPSWPTTCSSTRARTSASGRCPSAVRGSRRCSPAGTVASSSPRCSATRAGRRWPERRLEARERKVEGLMLKRLDSPYRTGRRRGDWWKWKIDPFQVDAVLLYAHPGNGRRANLFTDYTFAVWDEGTLVPVAKAYSGLSDAEIRELDGWVRAHTVERFGPVRAVEPTPGLRAALRGHRPLHASQVGGRGPLPAHRPLADRQAGERGGHAPDPEADDRHPADRRRHAPRPADPGRRRPGRAFRLDGRPARCASSTPTPTCSPTGSAAPSAPTSPRRFPPESFPYAPEPDVAHAALRAAGVARCWSLPYVRRPGSAAALNRWMAETWGSDALVEPAGTVHPGRRRGRGGGRGARPRAFDCSSFTARWATSRSTTRGSPRCGPGCPTGAFRWWCTSATRRPGPPSPDELAILDRVATAWPEARIVLAHLAAPVGPRGARRPPSPPRAPRRPDTGGVPSRPGRPGRPRRRGG